MLASKVIIMSYQQNANLTDYTFAFTGRLKHFSRSEASNAVKELGGKVLSKVSQEADYLVIGSKPGVKLTQAENIGVYIVDEDQFIQILKGFFVPKSDRRESRLATINKEIQKEDLCIPITDNDISDLSRMKIPAKCGCGIALKRILRRGHEHAWVCDGTCNNAKRNRHLLYKQGFKRITIS